MKNSLYSNLMRALGLISALSLIPFGSYAEDTRAQVQTTAQTDIAPSNEAGYVVGDATRELLRAQVSGSVAGPRLPMLGVTADASLQRYLDSYKHPLPEFYENRIKKDTGK
ncbi:MAG: DUF3613 domain-containing protein [Sulfuriferula sp.]|nr:DUF3613 domain-containing protein [Sulfuriferula sp.]